MRLRHGWIAAVAGVVLGVTGGLVPEARAGLYRCEAPDGGTTFTDDPTKCRGAREHEIVGAVESIPSSSRPPVARATARAAQSLENRARAGREALWREKKQRSEQKLLELGQRHERLRVFVTHCNRGGEVIRREKTGLKHSVSCNTVRSEYAGLEAEQQEIRDYLEDGIHEECRRSGCLPGWLR